MRAMAEPMKNCIYCQFSVKPIGGMPTIVMALISVATKESVPTHTGVLRLPRK